MGDCYRRRTCGATPTHALVDADRAVSDDNLLKMNPPLRDRDDRAAVFQGLLDGSVDWIESDHAPHTILDKRQGASGIPGFAGILLLIQRLRAAGAAEVRLQSLCGERVRQVYGSASLEALPQSMYEVPAPWLITSVLDDTRAAYAWDPFCNIISAIQ